MLARPLPRRALHNQPADTGTGNVLVKPGPVASWF
eukprot:SAG11_NODE_33411_length_277_cov_1.146067_1_plen_34_part_10